jgi:uncharacterized membrane protein YfcA
MIEWTLLELVGISVIIFFVAALYSSVGHGGASGYLAVLSFFSIAPQLISTTALVLNVLVSGIAFFSFARGGHFSIRLTWPFIAASIPAAFLGGILKVADHTYYLLLALALIVAAVRLVRLGVSTEGAMMRELTLRVALPTGAGIGLLSGMIGIGGGIFLSPLMQFMRWADIKQISATAACFILANSLAGLAGRTTNTSFHIGSLWILLIAAFAGGCFGSYTGARILLSLTLRRILAIVLLLAALKLVITAI